MAAIRSHPKRFSCDTYFQLANHIFSGHGIKITSDGERHLGAVIGTVVFRERYVSNKVAKWVKDALSEIAMDDP